MNAVEIRIGTGSCGNAAGAQAVLARLREAARGDERLSIKEVGCLGACFDEPLVEVVRAEGATRFFTRVTPDQAADIVAAARSHVEPVLSPLDEVFAPQQRIVLANCGRIDPDSLEEYRAVGGYAALGKALALPPTEVIAVIELSGLRGRGGAGFPTGRKWRMVHDQPALPKYLICNADEGDPGAFMDRAVLESDPFAVLEGMTIAAWATGATEGYIYCRAEYPLALARLRRAIAAAEAANLLGEKILGSPLSFALHIKEGAGAFVCGEETALIASIEGRRGMPRLRPPYPAAAGLFGKPTNINNVETFANVPWIVKAGGAAFAAIGTEKSKGTKVFALAGKVNCGGLVEVPMGLRLRDVIFRIGGGIPGGKRFKAVQLGGPSGGCLPETLLDTPVDYESLTATGAIMGSGGMVVMDETSCMVDIARFFLSFTQKESCGKCTFCRVGTKRMLEILERICGGKGEMEDIARLEELATRIKDATLCGLGQTAPNPVLTTLKYFGEEYEEHIRDRKCRALVCKPLITYSIEAAACIGCTRCLRACPSEAIEGAVKKPHVILQEKCVKCGACFTVCPTDAVRRA